MTGENFNQRPNRRLGRSITVIVLAVIGLGIVSSSALFTDNATTSNNTFTNGTIDIATDPTTTALSASNLAPGDVVYGTIKVTNSGTLPMRYSATSTATNADSKAVASQLQMTIKTGVSSCDAAGFAGGSTAYATGAVGGLGSALTLFGDSTTGQQTGDRSLAAGADETLCVKVALPSNTGNAYQGASTTATFSFAAEQTTNN